MSGFLSEERHMVYRGYVRNGKIELDEAAQLPEGAEVEVLVRDALVGPEGDEAIPTLYGQLEDLIGTVPDLPEDFSINHDHYLYGVPKCE